jgi:hypothetical protein
MLGCYVPGMRAAELAHRGAALPRSVALARSAALAAVLLVIGLVGACKEASSDAAADALHPPGAEQFLAPNAPPGDSAAPEPSAAPSSSAGAVFLRDVQASKLVVPPQVGQLPRLALSRTALARLTNDGWEVRALSDFHVLASRLLGHPLAVLALADGTFLALDLDRCERFDPSNKKVQSLPAVPLLLGAELQPDAQQPDRIWTLEGGADKPAQLSSYRLAPSDAKLVLPETTTELAAGAAHRFGLTREGIFLHLLPGSIERWGPGGARLAALSMPDGDLPTWALPAKRLDQSLWLRDSGAIERVWLSTPFKVLGHAQLAGRPVTAAVGNRGELLAAVVVTGPGPRFELQLLDGELKELGRAVLPSEEPTGGEDWVRVVTDNQRLAVSLDGKNVAVGGPARLRIFDARAHELFSIPSH